VLGPELENLLEELAINVHENWAKQRSDEGWIFGEMNHNSKTSLWQGRNEIIWKSATTPYRELASRMVKMAAPLLSYDVANEGLKHFPADIPLRQIKGNSLVRMGMVQKAQEILENLYIEGHRDQETLAMLGRVYKDLWKKVSDPEEKSHFISRSHFYYFEGYRLTGGVWSGINTATTALLARKTDLANKTAKDVLAKCESGQADEEGLYLFGTMAEAQLILKDTKGAKKNYIKARESAEGRWNDIVGVRRNAELILDALAASREMRQSILSLFPIPDVLLFQGLLVDPADEKARPRFPPEIVDKVKAKILDVVKEHPHCVALSSASAGGDILFAEAVQESLGQYTVVLPGPDKLFFKMSVEHQTGADWSGKFKSVLKNSEETVTLGGESIGLPVASYDYAAKIRYGLAKIRAEEMGAKLVPLALIEDVQHPPTSGVTARAMEMWRQARGEKI